MPPRIDIAPELMAADRCLHEETLTPIDEDEADDDPIPRDIDEFRRELARRLERLVGAKRRRTARAAVFRRLVR